MHLGVGAFSRAHLAVYVDDILQTDPSWGIVGGSLRRPDTRTALAPQDFLYTMLVKDADGIQSRVIGSILDVIDAGANRNALIAAMTDPRIRIVSLTVTEKGYCCDPATGMLDPHHPDIRHDLDNPSSPVSAPGLVLRAIELRRSKGLSPFTVLSCDNLPMNGVTVAQAVTGLASLRDRGLADYVADEIAFPSTMVDRIVPATTDADRKLVALDTGFRDAWPVVTEPFTQWVIEDSFRSGGPAFDAVGAQMVKDVRPFEQMKLRMLNGSHSALAYLGYLSGYRFVSEAIGDPAFKAFIGDFMTEEVMATLPRGTGNLPRYRNALIDRFANPALEHRTWQIAMDGSQKLPQRLLGTIRDRLAVGLPIQRSALGVAAWMRYVTGVDERGQRIDVRDPLATRLRSIADNAGSSPEELVSGLLGVSEIFGEDLSTSEAFRVQLIVHMWSLIRNGARSTVQRIADPAWNWSVERPDRALICAGPQAQAPPR